MEVLLLEQRLKMQCKTCNNKILESTLFVKVYFCADCQTYTKYIDGKAHILSNNEVIRLIDNEISRRDAVIDELRSQIQQLTLIAEAI